LQHLHQGCFGGAPGAGGVCGGVVPLGPDGAGSAVVGVSGGEVAFGPEGRVPPAGGVVSGLLTGAAGSAALGGVSPAGRVSTASRAAS
jgi:hypothetical protein